MKVFCKRCKNETFHDCIHELEEKWYDDYHGFGGDDVWQIIKCKGCGEISFRHINYFSEDLKEDGTIAGTIRLFPMRGENTLPIKNFYNLDPIVRNIYKESVDCFNNLSLTLCAVGIRSIIEGICKIEKVVSGTVLNEKPYVSKSLDGKIFGLVEKGILTKKHADILHELRFLGNEAVHELKQPSVEELKLAIQIIESVIENLYELDDKVREITRARKKRRTN